ncbi:MAG: hypothetical protein JJ892_11360 [Balneola sp.]|nr:hypothetical protein [Balneola sp.]MBO6650585.1 hypothetical protein [Balneola sp.]MBO6712636.1 hypothetical protein [Balneola sp.]MBO6800870.1 hypothetical protein [Balneola sp.]MBO6870543.1 hypothetical protein [Balneola sp.]
MEKENYICPGCGRIRQAPSTQSIARCSLCGTTVEKIKGVWEENSIETEKTSFDPVQFLTGVVFILLGFFLIVPVSNSSWGTPILNQSFLFWGIVSVFVISTITLIIGFMIKRKHAYLILRYSLLFVFAALIRLSFVENSLPFMQSEIYNPPTDKSEVTTDSLLNNQPLYTSRELKDLSLLFFDLMTDKDLVNDIDSSPNLNVKKTLDTSENNYDYEIIPSEINDRFPNGFRITIRDIAEVNLQNQYYRERAGGLGLKITNKNDAVALKDEIVQRFESNYELFESTPQPDNNHWISIKGENYYWVRFLTLDQDFMILEIIRYMDDANARQHKNVMEQVNKAVASKSFSPKPLSPQEAFACKKSAEELDIKKNRLDDLELRLTYLDFGDPKSEEHLQKERLFTKLSQDYQLDLKLYQSGCTDSVSLDFSTFEQVCNSYDLMNKTASEPSSQPGNRFCKGFPDYALRIQS